MKVRALAVLAFVFVAGCQDGPVDPPPAPIASVVVTPPIGTMLVGQTTSLLATAQGASGATISDSRPVTWSSSSPSVVSVAPTGVVTALAPGGATITATIDGKSGSAQFTVSARVASVQVTSPNSTLNTGSTATLSATPRDAAGGSLSGREIVWSSSNTAIATVSQSGVVTAVTEGGPVTITATCEGQSGSAAITIINVVAALSVAPGASSVQAGRTLALTATARDARGNPVTGRTFTWTTSNAAVASVASDGVVTGVAQGGPVTITASSDGRSASAQITVTPEPVTLRVAAQPSGGLAGAALAPGFVVEAVGANGQVVTAGSYDISVQSTAVTGYIGSVAGTVSRTTQSGVARFDDLRLTAPGVYTLTFRALAPTAVSVAAQALVVEASNPLYADRVSTGESAACASAAPRAFCWGSNVTNRIGPTLAGGATSSLTAFEVSIGEGIADLARGYDNHSCLLALSGKVYCVGSNYNGKTFVAANTSTVTSWRDAGVSAAGLSLGLHHSCLLLADGNAACVGNNTEGQLGTGTTADQSAPDVRVASGLRFSAIDAGADHTCGLVAGAAYCWGDGGSGQLGVGNTNRYRTPQLVGGGLRFSSISAGSRHTCAIAEGDRGLYCWGSGTSGQRGDGTSSNSSLPQRVVAPGIRFVQVSASWLHTCAVDEQNRAWCFGFNSGGRLGMGSMGSFERSTPQAVVGPPFRQVSAGDTYSCGITVAGTVWCWGDGSSGRLGNGSTTDTGTPQPVARR